MSRENAWAWLPAMVGALMMAQGSAASMPLMAALCNGGSGTIPAKVPQGDCDKACHAGCSRRKGQVWIDLG